MAKQTTDAGAPGERPTGKFQITVPNKGFRDERHGVKFFDGVGYTDDGKRAHACLEIQGATVLKEGKPWPEPAAEPADPSKAK